MRVLSFVRLRSLAARRRRLRARAQHPRRRARRRLERFSGGSVREPRAPCRAYLVARNERPGETHAGPPPATDAGGAGAAAAPRPPAAALAPEPLLGVVKWFHKRKGYGFIQPDVEDCAALVRARLGLRARAATGLAALVARSL